MTLETTPKYTLFGEVDYWPTPDPFHLETIKARSSLYDWEISPHRHADLLQLFFLRSGEAELILEAEVISLAVPCLLMVPAGCVHGFHFEPGVDGYVVTLPQELLGELLALSADLLREFSTPVYQRLGNRPDQLALTEGAFQSLADEYQGQWPGRLSVLMHNLGLILVSLARVSRREHLEINAPDRHRLRLERFNELIGKHFQDWCPVSFYAEQLGVTAAQLNNTCRREAGRSAQEQIHERLMLEARRLLAYSDLDITGIAYTLGFKDPAYFSRFFARKQNISPSSFRVQYGRNL